MADQHTSHARAESPSQLLGEPTTAAAGVKRPWSPPAFTKSSVAEVTKITAGSGDDADGRS